MRKLNKVPLVAAAVLCAAALSSCSTIKEISQSELLDKVGSFQINPVGPNAYWYNGSIYEYNQYEIKITSQPCNARIVWEDKYVGTTPMVHAYSGSLEKGERIYIRAIPLDKDQKTQETYLKVAQELPREIRFDFRQSTPDKI